MLFLWVAAAVDWTEASATCPWLKIADADETCCNLSENVCTAVTFICCICNTKRMQCHTHKRNIGHRSKSMRLDEHWSHTANAAYLLTGPCVQELCRRARTKQDTQLQVLLCFCSSPCKEMGKRRSSMQLPSSVWLPAPQAEPLDKKLPCTPPRCVASRGRPPRARCGKQR